MITNLFKKQILYIQIRKDHITCRNVTFGTQVEAEAIRPFTGPRMLVSDYYAFLESLRPVGRKALKTNMGFMTGIIHPMELIEGGLSEIEARVLREICWELKLTKPIVYTGEPLTDEDIRNIFKYRKEPHKGVALQ